MVIRKLTPVAAATSLSSIHMERLKFLTVHAKQQGVAMNTRIQLIAGVVIGSALLAGCEQRPEARPAPERSPSTPSDTTRGTTGSQQGSGRNQGSGADVQRAQTLVQRARQQIDAGQFDAAEQTLKELDQMKSNLPQAMQQQIDQMHTTLRNAKVGATPPSTPTTPSTPPQSPG